MVTKSPVAFTTTSVPLSCGLKVPQQANKTSSFSVLSFWASDSALSKWAAVIWEDFDPEAAEYQGEDEHWEILFRKDFASFW